MKGGNNADKLCHLRPDAYSAEQVLLNKQQIWCGGAYPDCYQQKILGTGNSLQENNRVLLG